MGRIDLVDAARRIVAAPSIADLSDAFAAAVEPLGMTAFASGMVSGPRALGDDPFHFVHWPSDWLDRYRAEGFVRIDPIARYAIVEGEAVSWTQILDRLPANDVGWTVQRAAREHGFYQGFATPVRTVGGALGLVSVGGGERTDFDLDERIYLQTLSVAALSRGEHLLADTPEPSAAVLTLRENECASLLAQGFTDAEVAAALAISITTVRSHLNSARMKLGVRNRVELANQARR